MTAPAGDVLRIDAEVADALAFGRPVVALESTIFSTLGLPSPANAEALDRCCRAVRDHGAVPAITAVLDGVARVGLSQDEHERVLTGSVKVAARDLGAAIAAGEPAGMTTVSAALTLAAAAGIGVFATGGIGGVHRGVETTGDVSSDLEAIARLPVVTVAAGAKSFLDLPRTLEHLEALSVPVVGFETDELPAFYARSSGLAVPHRVDDPARVAALVQAERALGRTGGVLVVVPIPEPFAVPSEELEAAIATALDEAARAGVTGAAVTPLVLRHLADATGGRSIPANLALAEHNAEVAARIAAAL